LTALKTKARRLRGKGGFYTSSVGVGVGVGNGGGIGGSGRGGRRW